MKTLKRKQILFVLITLSFCVITYAQQAEQTKDQLKFEISQDAFPLFRDPVKKYPGLTHIAQFQVMKNRELGHWFRIIQETPQWKGLSEKQRELIIRLTNDRRYHKDLMPILEPFDFDYDDVKTPPRALTFFIYGVSEEEAKKTAEAIIGFYNNNASQVLQSYKEGLVKKQNVIAEAQKNLPELKADFEKAEVLAEEKKNEYLKTNYSLESITNVYDVARNKMEEISQLLRTVNFELVGLEAKIESINKYKLSETIIDNETLIKLNQILITTDIERAGAIARKKAYLAAFKQIEELYDTFDKRNEIKEKMNGWESVLEISKNDIPELEKRLTNPPSDARPLEVIDNKVIIRPVKQD